MTLFGIDISIISLIVGIIASINGIIISVISFWMLLKFRKELALPEQISNVPKILSKEYIDRQFNFPIQIEDKEILTLREARLFAQLVVSPKTGERDEYAWSKFAQKTLDFNTWENKFAYEVSLGLEKVGLMVLSGGLPPNYVFEDSALLIIEDWGYCSTLVQEVIRKGPKSLTPKLPAQEKWIGLNRGHGEWLVYASVLYMFTRWEGEYLNNLADQVGNIETIRIREKKMRNFYRDIIPSATRKELRKLIDYDPNLYSLWHS